MCLRETATRREKLCSLVKMPAPDHELKEWHKTKIEETRMNLTQADC